MELIIGTRSQVRGTFLIPTFFQEKTFWGLPWEQVNPGAALLLPFEPHTCTERNKLKVFWLKCFRLTSGKTLYSSVYFLQWNLPNVFSFFFFDRFGLTSNKFISTKSVLTYVWDGIRGQACRVAGVLEPITTVIMPEAVFIVLFFTTGHRGLSQNRGTKSPEKTQSTMQSQTDNAASPLPHDLLKGQMLTYKATEVNGKIKWEARDPINSFVLPDGYDLKIQEDGYYFLNLQVTLKTSKCPCNGTRGSECMVTLRYNNRDLLQGWINTNTCSTGLLGKVEMLSQGSTVKFIIKMPKDEIDDSESLTHLNIIMLQSQL